MRNKLKPFFFGWALFKFLNKSLEIRSEIMASWRQEHLKKHVESNFTADKMVLTASGLAARDGETWVRPEVAMATFPSKKDLVICVSHGS